MNDRNVYRVDLRELEFVLFEQFRIDQDLLGRAPYQQFDADTTRQMMRLARDFAYQEMGPLYQSSDRDGCTLRADGTVRLPDGYQALWNKYIAAGWGAMGTAGAPYVLGMPILEMFLGANPSFTCYSGFCGSLAEMIRTFGSVALQDMFCDKLATSAWSACMCITEPGAGSDVGNIGTRAVRQDDGSYLLQGGKIFISAGYHDLTENTVYAVLARVQGAPGGTLGLSCFVVPRYAVTADGGIGADNHVRCVRLEQKMGLHGCATAQLSFGDSGPCRAYLLGEKENIGLRQLFLMMNQARISTGIFGLGMASSAYLNAAEYAAGRVQGSGLRQSFNPRAPRLPIIEHHDVRRMLLEMKSKVEGCRALIYKLALHVSQAQALRAVPAHTAACARDDAATAVALRRHDGLVNLLTPIVKAYASDQAWRVAELAIQVHGGYGYTSDYPVEQYARDIKILAIWEGTNYIQAADLVRDKLAMGKESTLLRLYEGEIRQSIAAGADHGLLHHEFSRLGEAMDVPCAMHRRCAAWTAQGKMELAFAFATRFLESMAEVTLAWLLLDAAVIAARRLREIGSAGAQDDTPFYRGKILSAQFFVGNQLPMIHGRARSMEEADESVLQADAGIFLERSQLYV
jgi:acyl-CoA dehydrogenase